ncbi:MAG TPA: DinB family protein [Anaerolineae bacterium]|nr:DinB family protein [Anaerolineae bacterium]
MSLTREQLLASLHTDWGTFIECYQRLSPEAQTAYLQQQGYARFADLLAHVIAWWQEGLAAIPIMLSDPAYVSPEYDVDQFNAQAVARRRDLDGTAVSTIFANLRQQWIDLVNSLPNEAFQDEKITQRLHIEIIGHYTEHSLA